MCIVIVIVDTSCEACQLNIYTKWKPMVHVATSTNFGNFIKKVENLSRGDT